MAGDYLSLSDLEFEQWIKLMCRYVDSKTSGSPPAWAHIPQAVVEQQDRNYDGWYEAYSKTIGPHTPEDTLAKNNRKEAAKALIRPFVNQYLRFPPVTDEDRLAMGIPNRDTKPSRVPAPTSQAEADLAFPGIHLLELLKIRKVGNLSDDAPRSDYGVSVHIGIVDAVHGGSPPHRVPGRICRTRCLPGRRSCSWTLTVNRARPSTSACATRTARARRAPLDRSCTRSFRKTNK